MDAHHQRLGSDTEVMVARLAETFALLAGDTKTHLVSSILLSLQTANVQDAFNVKLAETSSEAAVLQGVGPSFR
jgi:hypothetical protein